MISKENAIIKAKKKIINKRAKLESEKKIRRKTFKVNRTDKTNR